MTGLISAIIISHKSTEFLKKSLSSVLVQSLPRDQFEIVIVSDLPEKTVDSVISGTGAKYVYTEKQETGSKLLAGIQNSSGSILCFLDDDDEWVEGKLSTVRERFDANPELVFYHNSFKTIDEYGAIVEPGFHQNCTDRTREADSIQIRGSQVADNNIEDILEYCPAFNNSCISVKRDAISENQLSLGRSGWGTDSILFFSALSTGKDMLIDSCQLTHYRVHSENTTIPFLEDMEHHLEIRRFSEMKQNRSFREIVKFSRNKGFENYVMWRYSLSGILMSIYSKKPHRKRAVSGIMEMVKKHHMGYRHLARIWFLSSIIYIISPRLGRYFTYFVSKNGLPIF